MICTKSTVKAVEGDTVAYETEGKAEAFAGVDTVILATGMQPLDNLPEALKAKGIETFVIGGAKEVGYMIDATFERQYKSRAVFNAARLLYWRFSLTKPLVLPGVDKKALANNKAFKFLS